MSDLHPWIKGIIDEADKFKACVELQARPELAERASALLKLNDDLVYYKSLWHRVIEGLALLSLGVIMTYIFAAFFTSSPSRQLLTVREWLPSVGLSIICVGVFAFIFSRRPLKLTYNELSRLCKDPLTTEAMIHLRLVFPKAFMRLNKPAEGEVRRRLQRSPF